MSEEKPDLLNPEADPSNTPGFFDNPSRYQSVNAGNVMVIQEKGFADGFIQSELYYEVEEMR